MQSQNQDLCIMEQQELVKLLSDAGLRQRLMLAGEAVGPITSTTRVFFEKKLLRCMIGDQIHTSETSSQSEKKINEKLLGQDSNLVQAQLYYGVSVPTSRLNDFSVEERVFESQKTAMSFMSLVPGSRFKIFSNKLAAINYCETSMDCTVPLPQKQDEIDKKSAEVSSFRGPKIQDLLQFRKAIENGNVSVIKDTVWTNPRYLFSSGDTPTILQEGCRYNAFHVCAMKNQAGVAQAILDILDDVSFYKLLYPQDLPNVTLQRMHHIVDLYLNMPDKGLGETALHFACKFGHVEIAAVLLSHRGLDKNRLNKQGETAKEIICLRQKTGLKDAQQNLKQLFEDCFYVPLLESEKKCGQAIVGEPWSPDPDTPKSVLAFGWNSPTEAAVTLRAVAGPMSPTKAQLFRKHLLTPPSPHNIESKRLQQIKLSDCDKGYERIGRAKARELGVSWEEYWEFLGKFVDFASDEGLAQLENYLAAKYKELETMKQTSEQRYGNEESYMCDFQKTDFYLDNISSEDKCSKQFGLEELNMGVQSLYLTSPAREDVDDFLNSKDNLHVDIYTSDAINNSGVKTPDTSAASLSHADQYSTLASMQNEDQFDSDDSCDTFYTAANSPPTDIQLLTSPSSPLVRPLFIVGDVPSRVDVDVLRAVEVCEVLESTFPFITIWQKSVLSYAQDERNSWRTPISSRHFQRTESTLSCEKSSTSQKNSHRLICGLLQHIRTDLNKDSFSNL